MVHTPDAPVRTQSTEVAVAKKPNFIKRLGKRIGDALEQSGGISVDSFGSQTTADVQVAKKTAGQS